MPFLDRSGAKIYYEDHGHGPPILLSHGYSATCRMWDAQVAALAPRYRIIIWDMRGHGETDDPEDPAAYSEALTIGDMAALLRHCGIERAIIAGLSLGGYMSLAFHLVHPERVRALMLFDTGPGFRNGDARRAWNERAQQRARDLEVQGFAALGQSEEVRTSKHRSARGLAGAARGMLAQADDRIIAGLDTIAVPTLVLVGADDTNFLAAADYMARKIPGATRATIPDAGHASNLAPARPLQPRRRGLPRRLAGCGMKFPRRPIATHTHFRDGKQRAQDGNDPVARSAVSGIPTAKTVRAAAAAAAKARKAALYPK